MRGSAKRVPTEIPTAHIGASGQVVYEKGDDHLIDADRCALLAHYLDTLDPGAAAGSGPLGVALGVF